MTTPYPGEVANGFNAASFVSGNIRDGVFVTTLTLSGNPVAADVITINAASSKIVANIHQSPVPISYVLKGTDTTMDLVAAGLAQAINGAGLRGGVSAAAIGSVVFITWTALLGIVFAASVTNANMAVTIGGVA